MNLKHSILTAIIALLVAAVCFCGGMHHAITHMEIETTHDGRQAYVTLHENVYVHDLSAYPQD